MRHSIIVATHNRHQALDRLLRSLAPQLQDDELIVADNGTPEPTPIATDLPPVCHLHDARPGKCRMQNQAIRMARGTIVICLDDDLVASPDYLEGVAQFFNDHPEFAAMKGRILPDGAPVEAAGEEWVYMDLPLVDHGDEVCQVRGVLGANMAFRASVFGRVGLFDERLGPGACGHEEETEFSKRLTAAGLRIGYAPRALVLHEVDATRADRRRLMRIARERGYCRTLHERHRLPGVAARTALAALRLAFAKASGARAARIAQESRRLATCLGMLDGVLGRPPVSGQISGRPRA